MGLEFKHLFSLQVKESTYVQKTLYAEIYVMSVFTLIIFDMSIVHVISPRYRVAIQ